MPERERDIPSSIHSKVNEKKMSLFSNVSNGWGLESLNFPFSFGDFKSNYLFMPASFKTKPKDISDMIQLDCIKDIIIYIVNFISYFVKPYFMNLNICSVMH